jgi:hypothetical protein
MFFFKSVINRASHQKHQLNTQMSSSRNTTSRRNTAAAVPTPYCKVCRDAGKSEKEYTSHFVKDQPGPEGKIVCPTLLNQACRICHNTGHTSSYCPEYNTRRRHQREERYIEREQPRREERREERYIEREQPRREERREERYIEREQPRREERREERYIEREQPRREERREERYIEREQPRREERRYGYNTLREETERAEREIRDRDEAYYREQDRRSKPWLQAALKRQEPEEQPRRRQPYAHPHGPRTRLNLEATALCASKHADNTVEEQQQAAAAPLPSFDVRKVQLNLASSWGDEDAQEPFVFDPEQMFNEFARSFSKEEIVTLRPESDLRRIREKALEQMLLAQRLAEQEFKFIEMCDNQDEMPFECGQ